MRFSISAECEISATAHPTSLLQKLSQTGFAIFRKNNATGEIVPLAQSGRVVPFVNGNILAIYNGDTFPHETAAMLINDPNIICEIHAK